MHVSLLSQQTTPPNPTMAKSSHRRFNPQLYISYLLPLLVLSLSLLFFSLQLFHCRRKPAPVCPDGLPLVYIYNLPSEFNSGFLEDCSRLNSYTDMCPYVANRGLGQPLDGAHVPWATWTLPTWYNTHQFIGEMIFHARMENHLCRTLDPAVAELFYVPFYGGLHQSRMARETNLTVRDQLAVQLVEHLSLSQPGQPCWLTKRQGRDHFMVLGRTAWDFAWSDGGGGPDYGANGLLGLTGLRNVTVLTVERQPLEWEGVGERQVGIPYPSYFHPFNLDEVVKWQREVKGWRRKYLWSFVGAPRRGGGIAAVREELMRQCGESSGRCKLVNCTMSVENVERFKCHDPKEVIKVMGQSQFCLQAPGDSFTRRSTFDAVLTGCIPVFFSRHTAYSQYQWYFPADRASYSVYIDEKEVISGGKSVEEELLRIDEEKVREMREVIIEELMPRLTFAHPNASDADKGFHDVVDVALSGLFNKLVLHPDHE
ncbi:Probable xyloglucan galactosyltransferase GT17 [Linum grandiflorum]